MFKSLLVLAAFAVSSFAYADVDARLLGSWQSPCSSESGVYAAQIMTFAANGDASAVTNAYRTSDCTGTPTYSQTATPMVAVTSGDAGAALVTMNLSAVKPTEGEPTLMTIEFTVISATEVSTKITAASVLVDGKSQEIPAGDLDLPAVKMTKL